MHRAILCAIAADMRPACFLELGLGTDPCINVVAQYCVAAFGVDRATDTLTPPENGRLYAMDTDTFFATEASMLPPPDLVFIDADHRLDQVLKDLEGVRKIAAENCVVAIHDTWPRDIAYTSVEHCADSHKVPGHIIEDHMTIPVHPGLTLVHLKPRPPF